MDIGWVDDGLHQEPLSVEQVVAPPLAFGLFDCIVARRVDAASPF
jgi:hypothetical protein